MWLFDGADLNDLESAGKKFSELMSNLKGALEEGLKPDVFIEQLTGAENIAMKLQRSIGIVANHGDKFRDSMLKAAHSTVMIGGSMTDVQDVVKGLAESTQRMVILNDKNYELLTKQRDAQGNVVKETQTTMGYMISFSKATGMAGAEVGKMVGELAKFGGTQMDNIKYMKDLATKARQMGIDAKTFVGEVGKNMKMVSGFGFKNGRDGLEKMVKQASMLKTTIDSIGAKGFAEDLLDPESAIQAAANMQMLGGAVGKLADPFQLMHMAQSDIAGLQEELINSTKAAFKFNKETGGFEASTEDLYRLREQAKITGQNFDEMIEQGKEASKIDFLKQKFGLDSFSEEQQSLISGLSQIGEGGKVQVDIPGFGVLEAASAEEMKAKLAQNDVQKALAEYQKNAEKTDRQIAESQLTTTEKQAAHVKDIREAILMNMAPAKRTQILKDIKGDLDKSTGVYKEAAKAPQGVVEEGITALMNKAEEARTSVKIQTGEQPQSEIEKGKYEDFIKTSGGDVNMDNPTIQNQDGFFPSNGAPLLMSKNKLYQGIVGDEVMMGTNLGDALNKITTGSGKLDININLAGNVNGDNSNNVSKIFENPQVQKKIMDMVLYKLESYKKQQGVIG